MPHKYASVKLEFTAITQQHKKHFELPATAEKACQNAMIRDAIRPDSDAYGRHHVVYMTPYCLMQAVELGRRIGQGQGSRRVSMAGGDGRLPRRQGSWVEGRQSSGSGSRLGLRRQGSSGVISARMAPMQLEQLLTGKQLLLLGVSVSLSV